MAKHEPVTFGKEVANVLLQMGVPGSIAEGSYGTYHLVEGDTLTSAQMMAAVQADPDNLTACCGETLTCYVDGIWFTWDFKRSGWSDRTILPQTWIGQWTLERRPKGKFPYLETNLERAPVEDSVDKTEYEKHIEAHRKAYYKAKQDNGKPRPSLIPWAGIWQVIKVGEFGAKKYSPGSWKHVPDAKARYAEALRRHALEVMEDIDAVDPESGLSSVSHLVWCGLAVLALNVMKG